MTEAENNVTIEELTANPLGASLNTSSNQFCVVAPDSGCYDFIIQVTDSCGAVDSDTITVCVTKLPAATCPGNFTQFVCDLSPFWVPGFSCENADTSYVIGGTLSGDSVLLTPVNGNNTITLICENECGADTCTTIVNVDLNMNPKPECPASRTDTVCTLDNPICVSGFSVSDDQDSNLLICTLNGQPLALSNSFCYIPVS